MGAALLLVVTASSCGVRVPPGPEAADPRCADLVVGAPGEMEGLPRSETTSQGTVAWGSGADTIVLRCGVVPPGPTTDQCTRLEDQNGVSVDWLVEEGDDGIVHFTTYGRLPAIDVTVPRSVAPDQPSAVPLALAPLVAPLPVDRQCVGPEDLT
ncbi:DUF3515 family protein [Brachybacterium sp. EF45031]|nr:DUF3515 family protein [Brachybacterium sillae]